MDILLFTEIKMVSQDRHFQDDSTVNTFNKGATSPLWWRGACVLKKKKGKNYIHHLKPIAQGDQGG